MIPEERGFYKLYLPGKPEFNAYYISSSMAISLSYSINGFCWTTICQAWAAAELRTKLGQAGFGRRLDMLVAEHMKESIDNRTIQSVYEDFDENSCRADLVKQFDSNYAKKYTGSTGPDYERPDNVW